MKGGYLIKMENFKNKFKEFQKIKKTTMKNLLMVIFFILIVSSICFGDNGWVVQNSGTTNTLWSVYALDYKNIWAVGANGTIIHTFNGGCTWFSQYSSAGMQLQSVFFTSTHNGFAVGKQGVILRTTDGGKNWISQANPMGSVELRYIQFINANTGIIAGGDAYVPAILKTTDGGDSWVMQNGCYPIGLKGVFFVDANTGYCSAWLGWIYKTNDGGASWQCTHTAQSLEGLWFTNANTGTIVGYNGTILRTTNGGDNWVNQNPGPTTWYFGCYFKNKNEGYVTGNSGTLLKTTNGGQNWVAIPLGVSNNLYMISFSDRRSDECVGFFKKSATIVGSGGIILHKTFDDETEDHPVINIISNKAPDEFSLKQNYPNPFNPVTNISFNIMSSGLNNVSLKIYDVSGKEVFTLVNESTIVSQPGSYEVTWDASSFPSGVYYYKLQAGNYSETKKMLLIK